MSLNLKLLFGGLGVLGAGGGVAGFLLSKEATEKNISTADLNSFEVLSEEERLELEKYREEARNNYGEMCKNWGIGDKYKTEYVRNICKKIQIFDGR